MHKSNEDCFYFLTSSCTKGVSCTYRHSPVALTCNVICPAWLRGNCLEPACLFRHSTVQRPMISNGILCFYENTPMGCLKPDCTFIHSRSRMNSRPTPTTRPSSTNLINNDAAKSIVTNTPPTDIPPPPPANSQSTNNETQLVIPISTPESSSTNKTEILPRRIAIPSEIEQPNEKNTNSNLTKSTTRSVITDSPKTNQEEIPTTTQSRLIVNRNVVIAESTSIPNRKIVQTTTTISSSNRVVVSSDTTPSKEKKNQIDLVEQENDKKKFKKDAPSSIDTSSITNRLLLTTSKDAKPIRSNRDYLPARKTLSRNSTISVSIASNEEKTSAGTGLAQDDERRTMRIERFQKKPISPPRSIIRSSSSTITTNNSSTIRNVVTSSHNERKRTAPETTLKSAPPPKRVLTQSSQHQSSSRNESKRSSIRDKGWEKQTNEFLAKTSRRKSSSPQPVVPSEVRPRFTSKPIVPPPAQQSSSTKTPRLRQPPSVVIKRPVTTSTKPIEQVSSTSLPPILERQPSNLPNEEDENQLLKLTDSADIVDTFALIDEALLEADHLLELM